MKTMIENYLKNRTDVPPHVSQEWKCGFFAAVGPGGNSFTSFLLKMLSKRTVTKADLLLNDFELGALSGASRGHEYYKTRRAMMAKILLKYQPYAIQQVTTQDCPQCQGKGHYLSWSKTKYECHRCAGTGKISVINFMRKEIQ